MAEAVILLAVQKIGVALGNEAINQASSQLKKFITQLTELQGSMGRIRRELRLMHGYLCRMDVRNRKNLTYEIWVEELRMLVHGIEDIVDEYLHLVGQKYDTGWGTYLKKGCKRPNILLSLNRIASLVKEAEANLVHLFHAKDRWVSMVGGGRSQRYIVERSQRLASISRSLGEEDLVGVDENREKLVEWLADEGLERSVVALHGMGGLGKTALAANVYRNEREKFECHAWVSISQTFSLEDILRNLIKQLEDKKNVPSSIATKDITRLEDKINVPSSIATKDITSLEETLKSLLEQQKYLIIFDDVWTREAFNDLSRALVCNHRGSRLVITTREGDVTAVASPGRVLTLEALPKDKAWELFRKKAFPGDPNHECPAELKTLSEKIFSKCKCLPLATVSVGSLLCVREKTVEEWRRISDQLSWELINNPSLDDIRNVLHLSYIYLPTYLKSCFLYCSLFPEDYIFQRKKLARLWIAEGFIDERGESTMEEVAEGYMKELVHRNMLQLFEKNHFGRIKKFRMHDLIRELAVHLCQNECFGVAYQEDKYRESVKEMDGRRLVVQKLKKDIHQSISSVQRLRSVIVLDNNMPTSTFLPLLSEKSRYMSVLELSGLPIMKLPDAIGDLFNLRYLGLRGSKVKLLPKSIERLSNLLTLDLSKSEIQELPRGIVKLKKLRHLFAEKVSDPSWRDFRSATGVCIPKGLASLRNLQTLQALEAQDESIGHLGELRLLRSFRIWNVKGIHCGSLCEALVQMRFLSSLSVIASDEDEVLQLNALPPNLQKLGLSGRLAEGTSGESPLLQVQAAGQHLYALGLFWSQLSEDPLQSLSRLSNLTVLMLTRAYIGEQLVFLTGWFPKLKDLYLQDLPNLKWLEIQHGALASLEELFLVNLRSMTEVPPGIEFVLPLQYLAFREITREFLTSLRECPTTRGRFRYRLRD